MESAQMLSGIFWLTVFIGGAITLAYQRTDLRRSTAILGGLLLAYTVFGDGGFFWLILLWLVFAVIVALNYDEFRRDRIARPMLAFYRRMVPSMSSTEREALEAGTVWWEGELFSGAPDWTQLNDAPAPRLTQEEQAFLDGPVEQLCGLINNWETTHTRADLSPEVWAFMKNQGFFAMIIPRQYGGREFSAYAHSCVLAKIASHSVTAASTVAVPNSLGPAELLLHYGTEEQKDHYLPRLASGEAIPCFALTGPTAGSDAASIPDHGVICRGTDKGEDILGIRLNWDKRYITLAPVATVLGLAFKLYDPDHLLGEKEDLGITAALIPTDLPGISIGRRHMPLNVPFLVGPTQGKDVFVPLDCIIGGPDMAGEGWRMLVECLAVGRSISLPANSTGGAKAAVHATGAYARIRQQFGMPVGRFEGVGEALARIAGLTYILDAGRSVTAAAVDQGARPSVPSAILKYHCTEMGRKIANDAMDVHGGKGICLGPKNYLGRGYQSVPIAITVEGANILTRSLIIFGQGAIRCHPYVLKEMEAARDDNEEAAINAFDDALFGHIGYALSNAARAFFMALTNARYSDVPNHGPTRRYYQHITRYSAAFALVTDAAMLTLGGNLKKRESISARLGDVLSATYLASCVLKHYENQGRPAGDLPLVEWACRHLLYFAQEQLHGLLRNLPNRPAAVVLRILVFPRGRMYAAPSDKLSQEVVNLILNPGSTRERLCHGIYTSPVESNTLHQLGKAMEMAVKAEPIERNLRGKPHAESLPGESSEARIGRLLELGLLSKSEAVFMRSYNNLLTELIAVDDFASSELAAGFAGVAEPAKTKTKTGT
ncbi:MAG: acyl-CoA dehydrogenase, partial [Gammaproteobacteria bacterium]|nr:acyl-CoA dehydrogenase [Gammaproteobacteria bacterium]